MASMRIIKRKIKSVTSMQQITKAMKLVSVSKLQRAKIQLAKTRPFYTETKRVIASIVSTGGSANHPFLKQREVKKVAVIVLTGDRGLCGGYNINACKTAMQLYNEKEGAEVSMIVVGNKGKDYFTRRHKKVTNTFSGISEKPFYEDAAEIGRLAINLFESREADEVYLVYTQFKSSLNLLPTALKLLPVSPDAFEEIAAHEKTKESSLMLYEPGEEAVLDYVIPKYINTVIFGGMVESATCEQSARMTSMDTATDNADDMISKYVLQYNRARQGAITQEITEIISGANALE